VSQAAADLQAAIRLLGEWAATEPLVARVLVFGSRVTGSPSPDSDLDVAIELERAAFDEGPFVSWAAEVGGWHAKLQPSIPWTLDLQWHDPGGSTAAISEGLGEGHLQVWPPRRDSG
jgi:hypothetical protein